MSSVLVSVYAFSTTISKRWKHSSGMLVTGCGTCRSTMEMATCSARKDKQASLAYLECRERTQGPQWSNAPRR